MKKYAFIFPGQGTQTVGMGKDFYDQFPTARACFQEADELLHHSLSQLIFEGPLERLTETRHSQIAIYVTSMALLRVLQEQFPALQPSVCAGLSLGEYSALTASQKIAFSTCLPLVAFRGSVMSEACEKTKGTMAAILGLPTEKVVELVSALNLPRDLWVANFNYPGQTVLSGTEPGVAAGMEAAKRAGAKKVVPLQVHGAFHSGLMASAQEKLKGKIEEVSLMTSPIALVMNVPGAYVASEAQIRDNLIQQVTSSVRWEQSIMAMKQEVAAFIEIGPGRTLAGMNRQMGAATLSLTTVADLERIAEEL